MRLDLAEHDPEEFYGKTVLWGNIEFVVGRHIATGAESIVHRLVNRSTGDDGWVIKIDRDPTRQHNWEQPADGQFYLHLTLLLIFAVIELPGGRASIQPKIETEPIQLRHPRKGTRIQSAAVLYNEQRFYEALAVYRDLASEFPDDLEILFNFAALLGRTGSIGEAYGLFYKLVQADPYNLQLRLAWIRSASNCAPLNLFEEALWSSVEFFPMAEELRRTGIEIYLEVGRPREAIRLIGGHVKIFEAYYGPISEAFDSQQLARKKINEIRGPRDSEGPYLGESTETINAGLAIYGQDPVLSINLALAFLRIGQFEEAKKLLMQCTRKVRIREAGLCLVNAGFSMALAGNREEADSLFDEAVRSFSQIDADTDLGPYDVPNFTHWVEEVGDNSGVCVSLEAAPNVGLEILQNMGSAPRGSGRERLIQLYDEAHSEFRKRESDAG